MSTLSLTRLSDMLLTAQCLYSVHRSLLQPFTIIRLLFSYLFLYADYTDLIGLQRV